MILNYKDVNMNKNKYKEKLLEKTFAVIKKNIDNENLKRQVFSVDISPDEINKPEYLKISLGVDDYSNALDTIMDYFIEYEWYEDCITVKNYKNKLKKLHNERKKSTETDIEPVEAKL